MSETLIEHPPQTLIDHSDTGRSTPVGNTHTAIRNDDAFDRTAAVTIPGLLPSKVFERTRWQRQYAAKLRITDTMVDAQRWRWRSTLGSVLLPIRLDTSNTMCRASRCFS